MEERRESGAAAAPSDSAATVRKQADVVVGRIRSRQLYSREKPNSITSRFSAVILATARSPVEPRELDRVAFELRRLTGANSVLGGNLRHAFAAMILARGLDPADVAERMKAVRAELRERRVARGGTREAVAALFLVLHAGKGPIYDVTLDRMRDLLACWRKKHWLVTGTDDYPMAALLASGDEDLDALEARIEGIYHALAAKGLRRGNQLQVASHLLAVARWQPSEAATRFETIARSLKAKRSSVGIGQYDEVAVLSLTRGEPREIARNVVVAKSHLIRTERLSASLAFSLAVGTFLAEEAKERDDLRDANDLEAIACLRQAVGRKLLATTASLVGIGAVLAFGLAAGRVDALAPLITAFAKSANSGKKEPESWRPSKPARIRPGSAAARWRKKPKPIKLF